ncbi:hypothetical protein AAMO2058_001475700 [Amorphochlora amoebiformis]
MRVITDSSMSPFPIEREFNPNEGVEKVTNLFLRTTFRTPPQTEACTLVENSFDLWIQAILGLLAFLSLIMKRHFERPQRPLKIWGFDASKQAIAGVTVHFLNIAIAEFLSHHASDYELKSDECDFYFVNFVIDVVVGVTLTYILLSIIDSVAVKYGIDSLKSGYYGEHPKWSNWAIQLGEFMFLTVLIKLALFIFEVYMREYLDYVGYELFKQANPYPKLKLVFVMVAAPFLLNSVQFWLTDYILMADPKINKPDEEEAREGEEEGEQLVKSMPGN